MKINKCQSNKVLLDIHELFFDRKPIIKNSSYYTKLYSSKQAKENEKTISAQTIVHNNNNNTIQSILSKKQKSSSLKKVFDNKKISRNIKLKWPKITHAKWPFTKKRTEPKEARQLRLLSSKPSDKYHNFYTIRWLGQKYTESVKEKSIYSLLPNKGRPLIPESETEYNKRHRHIKEYLESFKRPGGREKFVNINPKYFYDSNTFKKILKLKEMFLEFDKKGNHRMIIKELVDLFKQNNINVDINEINQLFFKNIKNKNNKNNKKDEHSKYLNFYQFMNFALNREQDFRQFMRKVKIKNKIEENKKQLNDNETNYSEKEQEDNHTYIPMNFNSIFGYFINREKQRKSFVVVENAIKEMDKIIQGGNEKESVEFLPSPKKEKKEKNKKRDSLKIILPSKTLNTNINNVNEEKKIYETKSSTTIYNSNSSKNKIKDFKEQFKNISFAELIKEFSSLFSIKDTKDEDEEFLEKKNRIQSAVNSKSYLFSKDNSNKKIYNIKNIKNSHILNKYKDKETDKDKVVDNDKNEATFAETMKKEIRIDSLKNLNITNFEKYHDLKLALLATKEQVKTMKNTHKLIEEDLNVFNMVDTRDITNNENFFVKTQKDKNKTKILNAFKKPKIDDVDSFVYYNNNLLNIYNRPYSKTLKVENDKKSKKKFCMKRKKHLFNFYCGKPHMIDLNDDYSRSGKSTPKYDYVPKEFFSITKK
jgi:hypothetical protein